MSDSLIISQASSTKDILTLLSMLNSVYRPSAPPHEGMALEFPHLFALNNAQNLYYAAIDNQVVSMAGVYPQVLAIDGIELPVASIGCVATLPAFERRGIATKILNRIFDDLTRQDYPLALISGERGLYRRLDAVPVGSMYEVTLTADALGPIIQDLKGLVTAVVEEIGAPERSQWASTLAPIYWRQANRFRRTVPHMATLLDSLWFARPRYDQRLFTISDHKEITGYVVAYRSPGSSAPVTVMEWGGNSLTVLASMPYILNAFANKTVVVNFHRQDQVLASLITSHGVKLATTPLQGTVRILSLQSLLAQIQSLIQERYGRGLNLTQDPDQMWTGSSPRGDAVTLSRADIPGYLFNASPDGLGLPFPWTHDLNYI